MNGVFGHRVSKLTVIEFVADTAACYASVVLAFNQNFAHPDSRGFHMALLFALVMSLMYSLVGLYRHGAIITSIWALVRRAFLAVLIGAAIAYVALLLDGQRGQAMQRLGWAMAYVAIGAILVRTFSHAVRSSSLGVRRILVLGNGAQACDVARDIRRGGCGRATVVGFHAPGAGDAQKASLERVVRERRVDEIVVTVGEQGCGALPMDELLECRTRGVRVLGLSDFYESAHGEVPTDSLKASWLVFGGGFVQSPARMRVKRCFDILFSSILIVLAAPVMLLAALAIRLQGPGPVIYRQERAGLGGATFMCPKFRSMRVDAESDGVARWASRNDSRITPVGSFLRRTRIDELPQLFSVLGGQMSLVGPRPERPAFVAELRKTIPFYDLRHSVLPGLTGWAQVRYGYCATHEDSRRKHQFDLYYVKNHSLLLDLLVLVETVSVVLFREGSQ